MVFCSTSGFAIEKDRVAIALATGAFGSHIGIAFHTAKQGMKLIHLRFHHKLSVDDFPSDECWIVSAVPIPKLASKQLVGIIRAIAQRNPSIGYGIDFNSAKGSFDSKGHYTPPRGSTGLTCATFVTEVFRAALLPLIDESTWEQSDANKEWGHAVVSLLERYKVPSEHVEAVRKSVNGLRVRPEEVGAVCEIPFGNRPAKYKDTEVIAAKIMTTLKEICSQNP